MLARMHPWHHDMAALHQARVRGDLGFAALDHVLDPRSGGIEQNPRSDFRLLPADDVLQRGAPMAMLAPGGQQTRARQQEGAVSFGRLQVENHQARIVHAGVEIAETPFQFALETRAKARAIEAQPLRPGQAASAAHGVVKPESDAYHPGGPQRGHMRHHETQGRNQMRRQAQDDFAFAQRLPDQAKLVVLEIAQAAMDQLGAGR